MYVRDSYPQLALTSFLSVFQFLATFCLGWKSYEGCTFLSAMKFVYLPQKNKK